MQVDMRREPRHPSRRAYAITWTDEKGQTHAAEGVAADESDSGVGVRFPVDIHKGTMVYIRAEDDHPTGYAVVRHNAPRGHNYLIGLEFDQDTKRANLPTPSEAVEYYEFLQISPKAQAETIQRVYRFLAARYHPDNPDTGNPEKFLQLNEAYATLSDPERRARYDEALRRKASKPQELFGTVDFLDGVEGEINRRLAVLSVLYRKCRHNIGSPRVSLLELEAIMQFPREYLDFTIWYLRSKKLVTQEDNAELTLTCLGVDFVEDNFEKLPLLGKLLDGGHPRPNSQDATNQPRSRQTHEPYSLLPGGPVPNEA